MFVAETGYNVDSCTSLDKVKEGKQNVTSFLEVDNAVNISKDGMWLSLLLMEC